MSSEHARTSAPLEPLVGRRLLQQIASMVEHAYRRGFQHGGNSGVTDKEAYWFRYECRTAAEKKDRMLRHATGAPWSDEPKRKAGTGMTPIERLEIEIPCSESHADLVDLIRLVERSPTSG